MQYRRLVFCFVLWKILFCTILWLKIYPKTVKRLRLHHHHPTLSTNTNSFGITFSENTTKTQNRTLFTTTKNTLPPPTSPNATVLPTRITKKPKTIRMTLWEKLKITGNISLPKNEKELRLLRADGKWLKRARKQAETMKIIAKREGLNGYEPVMEQEDVDLAMHLTELFSTSLEAFRIPHFIYGGTLLGSYRHHNMIPWDDDTDIIVESSKLHNHFFRKIFEVFEPDYKLVKTGERFKFCHIAGKNMTQYEWTWPYVDIFFYVDNGTHITDTALSYGAEFTFLKKTTFPLHPRPFGKLMLPAPRDAFMNLEWTYGANTTCRLFSYAHWSETNDRQQQREDCSRFEFKYPFVHREPNVNGTGIVEELRISTSLDNYTVLQRLVVGEPEYAISKPYMLKLEDGFYVPSNVERQTRKSPWDV